MNAEPTPSGDELFAALEADLVTHRYRGQEFKRCAEAYEREGQPERRQQCIWDLWLFELSTRGKGDRFFGGTRFSAMASGTREDGVPFYYPDPGLFTGEVLAYYEQRAQHTPNPIHRARYHDILWETRRDRRFARQAALAYLDCVPVYFANDWGSELADALDRSKALALMLNDDQLKGRVVAEYLRTFDALRSNGRLRWFLEPLRSLLASHNKLAVEPELLIALAEEAAGHFAHAGDFWLERAFLEILEDAHRAVRRTDSAMQTKIRRAESFERQATMRFGAGEGALVALTFLRDALRLYSEIGTLPDKVEELKIRLKDVGEQAARNMKAISVSVELPREYIEAVITEIPDQLRPLPLDRAFMAVARFREWIPRYAEAKASAEASAKEFPLQHLFPTILMSEDNPVLRIETPGDKLEYAAIQNVKLGYRLFAQFRMPPIIAVLREKGTDSDALCAHLSRSNLFSARRLKLIRHGLTRFLERDYVSALHILVLQTEGLIRDLARMLGLPVTVKARGERMQERHLQDLLEEAAIAEGLGADFVVLLRTFLVDIRGDNLRHDVSHALLAWEDFEEWKCDLVLMVLLNLSGYELQDQRVATGNAVGPP